MFIIGWIVEILFFAVSGWVGHAFVKVITFGKVNLEHGDSSEGVVAEWIGVGVLLLLMIGMAWVIRHAGA